MFSRLDYLAFYNHTTRSSTPSDDITLLGDEQIRNNFTAEAVSAPFGRNPVGSVCKDYVVVGRVVASPGFYPSHRRCPCSFISIETFGGQRCCFRCCHWATAPSISAPSPALTTTAASGFSDVLQHLCTTLTHFLSLSPPQT